MRYRWFESISLQRRVCKPLVPGRSLTKSWGSPECSGANARAIRDRCSEGVAAGVPGQSALRRRSPGLRAACRITRSPAGGGGRKIGPIEHKPAPHLLRQHDW